MAHPVIQDEQIAQLAPSRFTARGWSAATDEDVRARFYRVYKPLRERGLHEYHLSRVATALYYYRPLLSELLKPTGTKTVLEIGSGLGAKALGWADLFQSYVGIDLNPDDVALANAAVRDFGLSNARFVCGNAEQILEKPEQYGIERIDLLVLYAVLEHLTLPERKVILRLAERIYEQGGHVLLAESPNRLCRFDQHSWQLPFTDWLPAELIADYAAKSARDDLKYKLSSAPPGRRDEALTRIGRGVSFHEFACYWKELTFTQLGIDNDGYSAELLNYYPFMHDEWDLLRYCQDHQIAVPRLFTRYWLEGLFSRHSRGPQKSVRYLPPQELEVATPRKRRRFWRRPAAAPAPPTVRANRHFALLDEITIPAGDALLIHAENPCPAAQDVLLLLDINRSSGRLVVEETGGGARAVFDLAELSRGRLPIWHASAALPVGAARGTYRVRPDGDGGSLTCFGTLVV